MGEWRYSSTRSLTSALDGGEWSASRPGRLTRRERALRYTLGRRLAGPQSRSECGGWGKNSQSPPGLKPPIIQPVAQRFITELSNKKQTNRQGKEEQYNTEGFRDLYMGGGGVF
jgi:hypothetical protein